MSAERRESRTEAAVAVEMADEFHPDYSTLGFTENVSLHGARVRTKRSRVPHDRVLIAALPGDFASAARVVYCEQLLPAEFAVGLELLAPAGDWILNPPEAAS